MVQNTVALNVHVKEPLHKELCSLSLSITEYVAGSSVVAMQVQLLNSGVCWLKKTGRVVYQGQSGCQYGQSKS